jgi:hypothetical protein
MNREDIIRMAQETGVTAERVRDLVNFASLVVSAEREACAKVCDVIVQKMDDEGEGPTGNIGWVIDCAEAIRARGQA